MKKTAVITGGTRGIGRKIALSLARAGYNIGVCYLNKTEFANSLTAELDSIGIEYFVQQCDIANETDVNNFCDALFKHFGHIDVLVNNASISIDNLFSDKTATDFAHVLNTNVVGTFNISKIIGQHMYDNKSGCIITISSTNGINTYFPMCADYDASKSAQISLSPNLAIQFAPYVRSICIAPGFIATESEIKDMDKEFIDSEVEKILVRRAGTEEDIANLVQFLCSENASFINNTVIRIDGGQYGE